MMPKKHLSVGRTERTIRFGMNDRLLFVLDPERYDTVMRWLDDPPAPGPKLRSLLCRTPVWQSLKGTGR
jgi:hypothetical protein